MDVVIKELMNLTISVLRERPIKFKKLEMIFEKLLEVDEIEIKEKNRNNGQIHQSRLPNEYKSFSRLEYIIKKWHSERTTGKETKTIYVFGEEKEATSLFQ